MPKKPSAAKTLKKAPARAFKNQIIGHDEIRPDQLLANPENWRVHSALQESALEDVLSQIGWVRDVLVNKRTGHVVDGHLRVMLAERKGEPVVPVSYIDVSHDEERLLLATLDPLAGLAGRDREKLGELVASLMEASDDALGPLLERMRVKGAELIEAAAASNSVATTFGVVVDGLTEAKQTALLEELTNEGYTCRALIS